MTTQVAPTTETPEPANPVVQEVLSDLASQSAAAIQPSETPVTVAEVTPTPPVATAPAETPVAVTATPPAPPVAPAPDIQQQYITRLEEQNRVFQQQQEVKVLQDTVAQHAQQLAQEVVTEYGITLEQALPFAQKLAKQRGDLVYQQYQAEQFRQGQINAAFAIAKEFGVDARMLLDLPTPIAMRAAANQATASNKAEVELTRLRAEIEVLKKGHVPPQDFANGQGAAEQVANKDNIDSLYMQWERANPNSERSNPYESQYRKFLYG